MEQQTNSPEKIKTSRLPVLAVVGGMLVYQNSTTIYDTLAQTPANVITHVKQAIEEGHKKIKNITGNY